MKKKLLGLRSRRRGESGFTILEYCAGAAIIIGVVWGAMSTLGTSMGNLIGAITSWANTRTSEINAGSTGTGTGTGNGTGTGG